jgi:hypothetical protein
MVSFNISIYGLKRGHDDSYEIEFQENGLTIQGIKTTSFTQQDNGEVEWSHTKLKKLFQDDSVVYPSGVEIFFESLWKEWKYHGFTEEDIEKELEEFAKWINISTKAKPRTDFFKNIFG